MRKKFGSWFVDPRISQTRCNFSRSVINICSPSLVDVHRHLDGGTTLNLVVSFICCFRYFVRKFDKLLIYVCGLIRIITLKYTIFRSRFSAFVVSGRFAVIYCFKQFGTINHSVKIRFCKANEPYNWYQSFIDLNLNLLYIFESHISAQ